MRAQTANPIDCMPCEMTTLQVMLAVWGTHHYMSRCLTCGTVLEVDIRGE